MVPLSSPASKWSRCEGYQADAPSPTSAFVIPRSGSLPLNRHALRVLQSCTGCEGYQAAALETVLSLNSHVPVLAGPDKKHRSVFSPKEADAFLGVPATEQSELLRWEFADNLMRRTDVRQHCLAPLYDLCMGAVIGVPITKNEGGYTHGAE